MLTQHVLEDVSTALRCRSPRNLLVSSTVFLATALAASACSSGNDLSKDTTSDGGAQGGALDASAPDGKPDSGDALSEEDAGIPGMTGEVPPPPLEDVFIYPDRVFTGFDGTNTYKVPIVNNLAGATWEVADPTILRIDPLTLPPEAEGFTGGTIVTLKAGTTEVRAKNATKTIAIPVTVQGYAVADVAVGKTRYETPENPSATRQACAFCHQSANGIDHSPTALAYFPDADILTAITTGMYPDGYVLMGVPHQWNLTEAEKKGIVPYLRSLPPRPFE